MRDLYPDAVEEIPPNAPEPRGQEVQINVFVDADHAGNVVTRWSHSGILIFLNMAPISWFSKKQNTVELSTFSSEFVALRIATELIILLRYKLSMFSVPINGPANVFCDNEAVYMFTRMFQIRLRHWKRNTILLHITRFGSQLPQAFYMFIKWSQNGIYPISWLNHCHLHSVF